MKGGKYMQVLTGSKRQITLFQWDEILQKAEKQLTDSMECQRRFGDHEEWVEKDKQKVKEIKKNIAKVTQYMDEHNIL